MTARTAVPDRSGAAPSRMGRASAWAGAAGTLLPGLLLCLGLTVMALGLQAGEEHLTGHPYVEALVLAILLGTALRSDRAKLPSGRRSLRTAKVRSGVTPNSCRNCHVASGFR